MRNDHRGIPEFRRLGPFLNLDFIKRNDLTTVICLSANGQKIVSKAADLFIWFCIFFSPSVDTEKCRHIDRIFAHKQYFYINEIVGDALPIQCAAIEGSH